MDGLKMFFLVNGTYTIYIRYKPLTFSLNISDIIYLLLITYIQFCTGFPDLQLARLMQTFFKVVQYKEPA